MKIFVFGYADGVVYVYVDKDANVDMVVKCVIDLKIDYFVVCNVLEILFIYDDFVVNGGVVEFMMALRAAGVEFFGGSRGIKEFNLLVVLVFWYEYGGM